MVDNLTPKLLAGVCRTDVEKGNAGEPIVLQKVRDTGRSVSVHAGHFFCPSPTANLAGLKKREESRMKSKEGVGLLLPRLFRVCEVKTMSMMFEELETKRKVDRPHLSLIKEEHGWKWYGAVGGLLGGILTALTGGLLTALAWFTSTEGYISYTQKLGTILLCLTIPMLIFGAHCLDLMEAQKDREKEVRLDEKK